MSKIILTADSTFDLPKELSERYNIKEIFPLHIILGDKCYDDGINITPEEIYSNFDATGILPKTAAVNAQEYIDRFKPYIEQGYSIIHINIGSGISSSHRNCKIAAETLGNIYPIDSGSLTSGTGLIAIEAAERIAKGMDITQIVQEVVESTKRCRTNFILDKLNYLRAGGRCSTIAMLGANILKIKPCIEVNNIDATMTVGKKYRGKLETVLAQYAEDKFNSYQNIKKDRVFIVSTGMEEKYVNIVYDIIKGKNYFDEIVLANACCTIASHCGPNTLGIVFMTE